MLENKEIFSYQKTGTDGQTPGAIYKKFAKENGTDAADAIATAARTGDEQAVFTAEQKYKTGKAPAAGNVTVKKINWLLIAGIGLVVTGLIYFLTHGKKKK